MHKSDNSFIELQHQFAAHIRNPEKHPKPAGIEERRMAIYRELFFNNIEGFISGGFPVLRSITREQDWLQMVRNFFDQYHCDTPYFLEIAEEFLTWLNNQRNPEAWDHPFMQELAHYEWVELALDTSEARLSDVAVDGRGDLLQGHPLQSPLAWSLMYRFPVHRIGKHYLPEQSPEQATYLMVYRNREEQVKFMEINQLTARLLYLLSENSDLSGTQVLQQIAAEMRHPQPEQIVAGGLSVLQKLRDKDIILGTQR
ncbi:MAG: DUF2063 domain-containing protein [Oceanospirillales bacterium]|nr:DUF2063 domain-containing protein [Oceanospirillales bacterium]MBR9886972.1 DUF2063 domain-containing protein [Oceanospirillales bacterium]